MNVVVDKMLTLFRMGGKKALIKGFDYIHHKLLIAKPYAYGFEKNSLCLINSYLKGRKQRTKINSSYSAFADILFGEPYGSILGPLLFSIYICDPFLRILTLVLLITAWKMSKYGVISDLPSKSPYSV